MPATNGSRRFAICDRTWNSGSTPSTASVGPNVRPREDRLGLAQKIGVGEHHPFGIGGGARGVEKGSQIVRRAGHGDEASGGLLEDAVEFRHRPRGDSRPRLSFRAKPGFRQHQLHIQPCDCFLRRFQMLQITKEKDAPLSRSSFATWSAW